MCYSKVFNRLTNAHYCCDEFKTREYQFFREIIVLLSGRATFTCVCDNGYRKVGSQCEPINECEENPGICGDGAICIDARPLYKCVCGPGTVDVGIGNFNKCWYLFAYFSTNVSEKDSGVSWFILSFFFRFKGDIWDGCLMMWDIITA